MTEERGLKTPEQFVLQTEGSARASCICRMSLFPPTAAQNDDHDGGETKVVSERKVRLSSFIPLLPSLMLMESQVMFCSRGLVLQCDNNKHEIIQLHHKSYSVSGVIQSSWKDPKLMNLKRCYWHSRPVFELLHQLQMRRALKLLAQQLRWRFQRLLLASFQISVGPQGLLETWITPDELHGVILWFSSTSDVWEKLWKCFVDH